MSLRLPISTPMFFDFALSMTKGQLQVDSILSQLSALVAVRHEEQSSKHIESANANAAERSAIAEMDLNMLRIVTS